jgi:hypothetical protein
MHGAIPRRCACRNDISWHCRVEFTRPPPDLLGVSRYKIHTRALGVCLLNDLTVVDSIQFLTWPSATISHTVAPRSGGWVVCVCMRPADKML